MDNSKNPQSVAINGIIDLVYWWIKHPASHSAVKNNRVELLHDKDPRESADFFIETFLIPALEENIPGDEWIEFVDEELKLHREGKLDHLSLESLYLPVIALAYYAQAIKSEDAQKGWPLVAEGKYWHGHLVGITQVHNLEIIKHSGKANDARHEENREVKEQFLKWFSDPKNKFRSKKEKLLTASQLFERHVKTLEKHLKDL